MWVSPFRYLRIDGYLLLPAAFRSLSRLSSALSAKASTLCSYCLTCSVHHSVGERGFCLKSPSGLLTSFTSFGFTSSFDDASDVLYLICSPKHFCSFHAYLRYFDHFSIRFSRYDNTYGKWDRIYGGMFTFRNIGGSIFR